MARINIPWEVHAEFHDCCYNCKNADLELEEDDTVYYGGEKLLSYTLSCIHYDLCGHLMEGLKERKDA